MRGRDELKTAEGVCDAHFRQNDDNKENIMYLNFKAGVNLRVFTFFKSSFGMDKVCVELFGDREKRPFTLYQTISPSFISKPPR